MPVPNFTWFQSLKRNCLVLAGALFICAPTGVAEGQGASNPVVEVVAGKGVDSFEINRAQCLNVALAPAASGICGEAVIVHQLPAMRTMNKTFAPALIYNARGASSTIIPVQADVTLPSGAEVPDSVTATLLVGTGSAANHRYSGTHWSSGATRRITVRDANNGHGLMSYTLTVYNWYGSTAAPTDVHGEVLNVSRATSPFGSGWWLAGLEQLLETSSGDRIWIGGDGSARLYEKDSSNLWLGANRTRPDSIRLVSGASEFVRFAPGGTQVVFDSATGRHKQTTDANGRTTFFHYNGSGRLDSISLPIPAGGSNRSYKFNYADGRLNSIDAHGQITTIWPATNGRIDSIADPDGATTRFLYPSGASRVIQYRDVNGGSRTRFDYTITRQVSAVWRYHADGTSDITRLRHQGSVGSSDSGRYVPLDPVYAHTWIDGPRTDVGDTTRFYLNPHGEPDSTENALGHKTRILARDAEHPALPTLIEHANGRQIAATYDTLGRILTSTDYGTQVGSTYATTTYEWGDSDCPDSPTRIESPEGDDVRYGYDNNCNREWQQDKRGSSTEVRYSYSQGRVDSVIPPLEAPTVMTYGSALGNLTSVARDSGYRGYQSDNWGRVTRDSTRVSVGRYAYTTRYYDAMGRDTLVVTTGDPTSYSWSIPSSRSATVPAETLTVTTRYDVEGNVLSVTRPRFALATDGSLEVVSNDTSSYRYDRLNRQVWSRTGVSLGRDSLVYDPAGNVIVKMNGGIETVMDYDELNRLTRRISEERSYSKGCLGTGSLCDLVYWPYYPNDGDGLTIPADTAVFDYDMGGNMTVAANGAARIFRDYYPNGLLRADTLRIRTYATPDTSGGSGDPGDDCPLGICPESGGGFTLAGMGSLPGSDDEFTDHVYVTEYEYDLNGRLETLTYPIQLPLGSVTYDYHNWGALESLSFGGSYGVSYSYDFNGRRTATYYPGSGVDSVVYDALGREKIRTSTSTTRGTFRYDSLTYDLLGRVTHASTQRGAVQNWYSTTGQLVAANWHGPFSTIDRYSEEFTVDPVGATHASRREEMGLPATATEHERIDPFSIGNHNELHNTATQQAGDPMADRTDVEIQIFPSGLTHLKHTLTTDTSVGGPRSAQFRRVDKHWYDGMRRLAAFQRDDHMYGSSGDSEGTFDEYRYDALGRRVLVRSRKEGLATAPDMSSYVDRFIWAGDQLIGEFRAPGGHQASASDMEDDAATGRLYGRVGYIHAGGIDRPVMIARAGHPEMSTGFVFPLTNWRGSFDTGLTVSGAMAECSYGGEPGCPQMTWPGDYQTVYGDTRNGWRGDWMGSLAKDMLDDSGLAYRRNRYYDPSTGEFTQVDPIGIAGGLNLYGYANGDPVSNSDPFGLCPWCIAAVGGAAFEVGAQMIGNALSDRPIMQGTGKAALVGAGAGVAGFGAGRLFSAGRRAWQASRSAGVAASLVDDGALRVSGTVASRLAGERSYIPTQAILETVEGGVRAADPQGAAGRFMYTAEVSFTRGGKNSSGTLEVLVNEGDNIVEHVLYRSGGK